MKTTFSDVDSAESHSINDKYSEKNRVGCICLLFPVDTTVGRKFSVPLVKNDFTVSL